MGICTGFIKGESSKWGFNTRMVYFGWFGVPTNFRTLPYVSNLIYNVRVSKHVGIYSAMSFFMQKEVMIKSLGSAR